MAAYVRMSTDHQRYSTDNQSEAINDYAAKHGMVVVITYADEGKSGLDTEGREQFRRLIADIQSGRAAFKGVLVYDVSRWGRFQNTDESAHYEYLCTKAGVPISYCAEPFDNDGKPMSTVVKNFKRWMDGEYSRVLSTKVFIGQCHLVGLGFHQGGTPGYGLRRELLDERRISKGPLRFGEHKSIQTDRVILVPGPPEEITVVHRIYRDFIEYERPERAIADTLNAEGLLTDLGRAWTRGTVHQILTNEKYIGNNVYNRQSFKLKQERVRNAPEFWIRCDGAFQGIVSQALFEKAREIIVARSRRFDDAQMLALLRELLERSGTLSGLIIDEQEGMPSSTIYRSRFGGLIAAYALVGFKPDRDYRYLEINRELRRWRPDVTQRVIDRLLAVGAVVQRNPITDLLTINHEWTASVVVVRCQSTPAGMLRWRVRFDSSLRPDITIAVRMDSVNAQPRDYYLIPSIDTAAWPVRVTEENPGLIDSYRFDTLEVLDKLAARCSWKEAA
ncbi:MULTISPECIES: recombinase family protein [unclassified Variovorax]|uniref:recombinase family protein n=1 Tax=unclassified Variovorax TaxID=663243 RepID=UPI003F47B35C